MALPDPMPNSEVKRRSADGSVGFPHVRVGHRQVLNVEPRAEELGVFVYGVLLKISLKKGKCGQNQNSFIKDV